MRFFFPIHAHLQSEGQRTIIVNHREVICVALRVVLRCILRPISGFAVRFAAAEVNLVRHNFRCGAVVPLLVGILPGLDATSHQNQATLLEPLGNKQRRVTKCGAVKEIGFLLTATLTVASNAERANILSRLRNFSFWRVNQTPLNCDRVKHCLALLRLFLSTIPTQDAPKAFFCASCSFQRSDGAVVVLNRLQLLSAASAWGNGFRFRLLLHRLAGSACGLLLVLVRVSVLRIVNAEQTVQSVLSSVAACSAGNLRIVHAFLKFRLTSVCSHRVGGTILRFNCCSGFDVVPTVNDNRLVGKPQHKAMRFQDWLDRFENVLARAVLVTTELVHLPLRGFQL
nr:MAG TPA: hypothetical protein [Caudoviricetes sp.]